MSRKVKFGSVEVSVDGEKLKVGDIAPDFLAIDNELNEYLSLIHI